MAEANISTTKNCTWCKKDQDLICFHNDKNRKDGKHPHCKSCNRSRMQKSYAEKKEEYAEKNKLNYLKNKDSYKLRAKEWAEKNPQKRKEVARRYVLNNPEKRHETSKNNRLKNPWIYAAHFKARQQRKRQAMPLWASEEGIKAIYRQSAWATKISGVKHHVDHYYPLKSDIVCGLHNEFNLRIITAAENLLKYNNFPTEEQS